MKKSRTVPFYFILLACFWLSGCSSSSYLTASGKFARAMEDSVSTLRTMKDNNSQMCRQRIQLDYLFHRIENKKSELKPVYLADYFTRFQYPVAQADGTVKMENWNSHCNQIGTADAILDKALVGLAAYANAVITLSGSDYSGNNLKSLAKDAGALAAAMKVPSRATAFAQALADPLQQLSGALLAGYAKKGTRKLVREADPSVRLILNRIGKYLDALAAEELDLENQMRNTLNAVDAGLSGDSLEQMQFSDLAFRWITDLQAKRDAQQALVRALIKLDEAQSALARAGEQPNPDTAAELKTVLGNAILILKDVQAIEGAIQGKGGK